jgi:uncharacterized protein YndB with AHSA1/START domain
MAERVVEKWLELEAPIVEVWRAISEPEELSRWFGQAAELELRPGAEGAFVWDEHGAYACRVEEVEPPHRLVWSWVHQPGVPFAAAPATRVVWTLEEMGPGRTRLHLVESGFLTDEHHGQNDHGWDEELAELQGLLEPATAPRPPRDG